MSSSFYRRTECRLCRGTDLEMVLHLAPTPVGDAYVPARQLGEVQETYPLEVFLCRRCGLAQLIDVVDPKVLYDGFIYTTSISLGLAEHFRGYADKVLQSVRPPEGALVVDIGSNDGTLLRFFKEQGMRVLGIDPARETARKATESGVETLPVFFTPELARQIKNERGAATIITANHTLANIDNPEIMIAGIRDLLSPEGVFIFETGYLLDLICNTLFDNIYHEHLCYFSVKPLDAFFRHHGMELIEVQRVSAKGGSIRATVQLADGPRVVSSSVDELKALETKLGIDRGAAFKPLADRINRTKDGLISLMLGLKSRGKTLAGYGASVGVTTLIYYFDIAHLLSFLSDDNPAKQGLFSPGCHIPVLSSQALCERKPDNVLILAWRFAEPIIRKNQSYLNQGGHFIVPLPKIKIR